MSFFSKLFKKPKPVQSYFAGLEFTHPGGTTTSAPMDTCDIQTDPTKPCENKCGQRFFCCDCCSHSNCVWLVDLPDYDSSKPSILLIDDNPGVLSFLSDDFDEVFKEHNIDASLYNILKFTSQFAVYHFLATSYKHGGLNVEIAVIDITYGGCVPSPKGNVRLTGVDVFNELYKRNPDVSYLFYTGNSLNAYIKSNYELMEQFEVIADNNIMEHVLFKDMVNMDERRDFFYKKFFEKENSVEQNM